MNCAVHNDVPAVGYCRTCGKPMCEQCQRDVRGVIYCEDCLAARVHGTLPVVPPATAAAFAPATQPPPQVIVPAAGPHPAVAAVLAVFFPFGVPQVYIGQYAKGFAHLVIFALLVAGASSAGGNLEPVFGIGIAGFYIYQIIDSYRSAKAVQMGQPAPDPFGLGKAFGAGERMDTSKVPIGAVVLIGLGFLFLLNNMGFFRFWWMGRLWPLFLIGLGIWLFMRRSGRA